MKAKSESEVAQSCPTLSNPMLSVAELTLSLPGSSVYGIFQARVLEWGAIAKLHKRVKISVLALSVATEKSLQLFAE